jgi:RNA polymerase sigma-70 factor (ECF subfamily)
MDDCTIIKKLKQNKEKALEALMDRYISYVTAIAVRIGGYSLPAQDIEEIVSDVFYTVWRKRESLLETDSIRPYIAQIARNITKKRMLKNKETEPLEEGLISHSDNADEHLIRKEEVQVLYGLITELKHPDKDILIDYYFRNQKLEEISEHFCLPLSTVKSKVYRGKKGLIEKFKQGGYQYEAN